MVKLGDSGSHNLYYVKSENNKKQPNVLIHNKFLSDEKQLAIDLLKWCCAVYRLTPDSPRLAYFASRWRVLEKIDREKREGIFSESIKTAPIIDARHIKYGLAAIEACREYSRPTKAQILEPTTKPIKSKKSIPSRKRINQIDT